MLQFSTFSSSILHSTSVFVKIFETFSAIIWISGSLFLIISVNINSSIGDVVSVRLSLGMNEILLRYNLFWPINIMEINSEDF